MTDAAGNGARRNITFTGKQIPGTNYYAGVVWVDGTPHQCEHRHSGLTSAKACADLRKWVES